jgi:flagellar motor switch protein FliN/FliY
MTDKPRSQSSDLQLRIDPPARPLRGGAAAQTVHPRRAASEIDDLLTQAERALAAAGTEPTTSNAPPVTSYQLAEFTAAPTVGDPHALERIRDVELDLKIELGRTQMALEDVLKLRSGSIVPLDKLAGDPVDIVVNGRLVARGEVLVLNDNFCVRVLELLGDPSDPSATGML